MHISHLSIANFKGLNEAEFVPTRFACLVGENNAGKSTVLQAIATALNRPSQLSSDLYYDETQPIEFSISFEEIEDADLQRLAPEHQAKITPLIVDGKIELTVRYSLGEKVEIKVLRLSPIEERYKESTISDHFKGKQGKAVREALEQGYPEFVDSAPEAPNIGAAKEYLHGRIAELPADQFRFEEAPLPSGIPSSISSLLPEPIYIPAVKNLADDLKTSQSTSFGRLLGLLLEDMTPDLGDVTQSLEQLNSLFNRVMADGEIVDERHERVRDLESAVESFLQENFPTAKVELQVPPPELQTILNSAKIYVDDGSKDLIDNKGDGIKRSLTFALLQCYVERLSQLAQQDADTAQESRPLIFLFEEPELYLHPKSQRILFDTLARISKQHQIVVTTHSPLFFAPGATASFVRIAKQMADPKPVGILYPVNFDLEAESAEVFKMAKFENADAAFFSQRVVLFEGESDDAYVKHIAKLLDPKWDFDRMNIAMVRVSGKGNFSRFRRFFESFGVDVKIVADLDALFDGYAHLGAPAELGEVRNRAIQAIDARIAETDITPEPSARQIKDKVKGSSWRTRYENAKAALRSAQEDGTASAEQIELIDGLFTWEDDFARVRACREDDESRNAIVPLLDALRNSGICVLANGAIEDYYSDQAPTSGPKPTRALTATQLIVDRDAAIAVSRPLVDGRDPELVEVCQALFDGL